MGCVKRGSSTWELTDERLRRERVWFPTMSATLCLRRWSLQVTVRPPEGCAGESRSVGVLRGIFPASSVHPLPAQSIAASVATAINRVVVPY